MMVFKASEEKAILRTLAQDNELLRFHRAPPVVVT